MTRRKEQKHKPKPTKAKAKATKVKVTKPKPVVDTFKAIENREVGLKVLVKSGVITPQQVLDHFRKGELNESITKWMKDH